MSHLRKRDAKFHRTSLFAHMWIAQVALTVVPARIGNISVVDRLCSHCRTFTLRLGADGGLVPSGEHSPSLTPYGGPVANPAGANPPCIEGRQAESHMEDVKVNYKQVGPEATSRPSSNLPKGSWTWVLSRNREHVRAMSNGAISAVLLSQLSLIHI